jgi:hypothetical protein
MSTLKLRKIFAAFTLTTLVASLFVVAPATQAAPPSWWTEGTDLLDNVDPMFGDENQVEADKCRVSAVLTAALGLEENPAAAEGYIDIPAGCEGVAGAMIAAGIIKGEANGGEIFGAGSFINRAVFATMLSRAYNLDEAYPNATLSASAEADLADADWAKPYYAQVMAAGIYKQTRPADQINIYEITTAVHRAMNPGSVVTDPVGNGGDLEVTISDNTPEGRTVPGGVQNAHIATFEFEAGEDDVLLTSIEFAKGGIADDDALDNIALFSETGQRVSKAKSFRSSDDTANVNFLSGGFTVEAGESIDLLVFGEVGSVDSITGNPDLVSDEFFIQIKSADAIVSNASSTSVSGAKSNTMRIGSADAAELVLSDGSSSPDVSVGERGVEVYEFEMENNASDETEIVFYGITLEAEGSFDEEDDLMNYSLYIDGEMVASTEMGADGFVSFLVEDADGYILQDGKTVDAVVKADIMSGANETISFGIDSELDVLAADASFGTGAKITGNINGNTTTIDAGEITLVGIDAEKDEFTEDTDEFVLGTVRVTSNAGRNLELQEFKVSIEAANLADDGGIPATPTAMSNVSDVIDQVEVSTPYGRFDLDLDGAAGATEIYEDDSIDILLPEGETFDMVVTVDIKSGLDFEGDETLELSMTTINGVSGTSFFYVEELGDDEAVEDITPSSLSFNSVNAEVASLEIRALTQSDKNVVVGADDVIAMHFELEASDSEDITVNDIEVEIDPNNPATNDNDTFSNLSLYMEDTESANLLDSQSGSQLNSGKVEFDNLDLVIPAGETVEFFVLVSIVDDAGLNGGDFTLQIEDIDADDEDNDTVSTINSDGNTLADGDEEVSTRVITLNAAGTLTATVDNSDPATNRKKLVLAGTTSDFVASYELNAVNEAILVEEIQLDNVQGTSVLEDGVAKVMIYGPDKTTLLATESVTSDTVVFENFDYIVEEGSENLYVKVETHKYGKDEPGVESNFGILGSAAHDYELELTVTELEGVSSGEQLAALAATDEANGFAVAAVKLDNLSFVDSYDGVTVGNKLVAGENVVAILKIDNAAHMNTTTANGVELETYLQEITLDVNHNTMITAHSIERLDRNADGKVSGGAIGGNFVTLDLTDGGGLYPANASDNEIESGEVAYYAITVTVTLDGNSDSDEFVKVLMDNFRTANSAVSNARSSVVYSSNEAGAELVDTARIKATRIEAKQLNETN